MHYQDYLPTSLEQPRTANLLREPRIFGGITWSVDIVVGETIREEPLLKCNLCVGSGTQLSVDLAAEARAVDPVV